MSLLTPRFEILPPAQRRLWPELRPALNLGFVLYGGTALALRLGHRPSIDFDFFTEKSLDRNILSQAFSFFSQSLVLQDERNALTLLVPYIDTDRAGVKVSFFGEIGFGRIATPDLTVDGIMQVASADDLMATKLKVILQRAEAKDYKDIAAMIQDGVSLAKGLSSARAVFGLAFQPSESLKALTYFGDGDLATLAIAEKNILLTAVKAVGELPSVSILSKVLRA
ncbi:MAG: nucleotidyl transferase AbiEii/AbiGii toxin family protein [Alcaligenaceae bacterium]